MKRLFRFVAIVLPGLLGIILSSVAANKIFERYSVKPADVLAAQNGSFLPRAPLVNLNNNHDEYQNVIRGKVLLLFVTTDCDACGKELSNVSDIAPRLLSKVRVYGVGIEDPDSVKTFAEKNHVGFPMLLDHGATILARLGFRYMPTKVLLQDGVISKIWYGSSPDRTTVIKDVGEADVR